jgi:hypothetical protein
MPLLSTRTITQLASMPFYMPPCLDPPQSHPLLWCTAQQLGYRLEAFVGRYLSVGMAVAPESAALNCQLEVMVFVCV